MSGNGQMIRAALILATAVAPPRAFKTMIRRAAKSTCRAESPYSQSDAVFESKRSRSIEAVGSRGYSSLVGEPGN
jgi:hypothetical protein